MCGIFCTISRDGHRLPSSNATDLLQHRGPDIVQEYRVALDDQTRRNISLSFSASVLSLRGSAVTPQPLVDTKTGSVLCWNGEAWKLFGEPVTGNDGAAIFELLTEACQEAESHTCIVNILQAIRGPFAFVFCDGLNGKLYFGRDCLGRRSLLRTSTSSSSVTISSVYDKTAGNVSMPWDEVETDGIHIYDLSTPISDTSPDLFAELVVPFVVPSTTSQVSELRSIVSTCL
jgi:asparagine synthetase B (glutamine-hydrolysing)